MCGLGLRSESKPGREVKACGEFAHLRLLEVAPFGQGITHTREHQVLKHFWILRVDHVWGNPDCDDVARTVACHNNFATANAGLDCFLRQGLLRFGHVGLHFLGLAHHFLNIHKIDIQRGRRTAAREIGVNSALAECGRCVVCMQMRVLVIETSSSRPSIAWRADRDAIREVMVEQGRGVATRLVLELAKLRHEGFAPERVVVGCGPGSYSGLRGGLCAAQGFGLALGIEVFGVCSLFGVEMDRFVAVGDAGRQMAYVASVDRTAGIFVPRLVMIAEVASAICELPDTVVQISNAIEGVDAPVVEPQARALLEWLENSAVAERELRERPLRPIYLQGAVAGQPACHESARA